MADSTMSVARGPMLFPTAVTAGATLEAIAVASSAVGGALVVVLSGRHGRLSGVAQLVLRG